ncbi:MAG TPA: chain length-determining protein [Nitrospirae bacterium]|nr:chain length-determining protein [Nitrospirota bacterium]
MPLPYAEIQKYLKMILKRRYLFISVSLFIMSVIVWGGYFIPGKYEAQSSIIIERNVINDLIKGVAITPSMTERIKVLRDTMLSRSLILSVLRKLDLDTLAADNKELEKMILDFQKKTSVKVKKNNLFIVSFQDKDPRLARDYVNSLVRTYVNENVTAKREEAYGASRFLKEQVAFFKEKLDRAEDVIIKFRQDQGIYVAIDERSLINEIKEYGGDISKIKIRRNELIARRKSIKRQIKGEEPYSVAVISNMEGSSNILITSLQNRLNQLLVSYTENYPGVLKLKAEIEALKKQQSLQPADKKREGEVNSGDSAISTINPIYQGLKQELNKIESEINALAAKKKMLGVMIKQREKELRYIPEGKKKLADLEKKRDSYRNIYEQLLMRLGQSEVSKQMEVANKATTFRIAEPAILPTVPVSPNRKALILAGIFFGFLGGFGAVFLRDSLDSSVKEVQTVKDLGLEVLAVIPKMFNEAERKKERKKDWVIYTVAGFYFLIICAAFIHELLGLTYIETVFVNIRISLINVIAQLQNRFF